jgi:vacuolar protein sorting-associated protein VTA1
MKRLLPYIKRAEELELEEPLASFYCRTYVVENLLKDPSLQSIALDHLTKAESLKVRIQVQDLKSAGPKLFEDFCLAVYSSAEEAISVSPADAAMRFYFAALFFDVLTQFGPLKPELEDKRARARRLVMELRQGGGRQEQQPRDLVAAAGRDLDNNDKMAAIAKLKEALRILETTSAS